MSSQIVEVASAILFFLSFYGLITTKKVAKSVVAISLMEISVIMFFLSLGFIDGMAPPIGPGLDSAVVSDPLPQALVITAIIIGVTVCAVSLAMLISYYRQYETDEWDNNVNNVGAPGE